MALANTAMSYGRVARALHWSTAILIFCLIPLGFWANSLAHEISADAAAASETLLKRASWAFSLHKTTGVALFGVAVLRILWALTQVKPAPLHPDRRLEHFAAEIVHWVLYGSLIIVPITGWISHAAQPGFAPLFGPLPDQLPFVPESETVKAWAGSMHQLGVKVLGLALVLHVAGALKHHFIDRDVTLLRMVAGADMPSSNPTTPRRERRPFMLAVAVWVGALVVGASIGVYSDDHSEMRAALPLEGAAAAGDAPVWMADDVQLDLVVTLFGREVRGNFGMVATDIRYDPETGLGAVDAIVDITSMQLGANTEDALSASYLDAQRHPGARFSGVIQTSGANGPEISGMLRLRGTSLPLTLPFTLSIDRKQAEAAGSVTINRLDYGIGEQIADEATLAYEVRLDVRLTATEQE